MDKYGDMVKNKVDVYTRLSGWECISLTDLINETIKNRCDKIGYWWSVISIEISWNSKRV